MLAYKTFSGSIKADDNLAEQQNAVRNELVTFMNKRVKPSAVIDICETAVTGNLFTITVWYNKEITELDEDIKRSPEAQSADVLSRSLHEQERRELMNTMVDEHIVRSSSS